MPNGRRTATPAGAAIRALAAKVNAKVVGEGVTLERALTQCPQPAPRDSTLLSALSYGVLRWHHRLQWQAAELLDRPLNRNEVQLASLIRVGLFQLQWLRIPDHAAVSATVAATGLIGAARAKGVVNAVLRRFQRERAQLNERLESSLEAVTSHPGWMVERLRAQWPAQWEAIVDANNQAPPMWLRVNARRATRAQYLARLATEGIGAHAYPGLPDALLLAEPRAMSSLPGFSEGLVSVQDGAAQLAAGLLRLAPGLRVLDACAAPGGKSAHMLERCPELGEVVAVDRDAERLEVVKETFERLGLSGTVIHADATDPQSWWDERCFDRILLDAPCSALGVIRRHPDIKVLRSPGDVARAAAAQAGLLDALWPLLAPGGRLVYATCTILGEENHAQISSFLERMPSAKPAGPDPVGGRQILPGEANMDGFYYACLDKNG